MYYPLHGTAIKGSLVHVAPACAGSGEGSDHFVSYVRKLTLHFCKRPFPGPESITSWAQGNMGTAILIIISSLLCICCRIVKFGSSFYLYNWMLFSVSPLGL
jgi:hypothetical protein